MEFWSQLSFPVFFYKILFPRLGAIIMDDVLFQVAIVVGGGNIFRGSSWAGCSGLDRSSADYIG